MINYCVNYTGGMSSLYPVMLDLTDIRILIVGGGVVASRKAKPLVECGARVNVISPAVSDEMRAVGVAEIIERAYQPGDGAGFQLIMTATDVRSVNALVAEEARAAGQWVNSADDPENCSFILPALIRRGPVTIAVSTGGASPSLAGWLRDRIGDSVGPEVGDAALELLAERTALHEQGKTTEGIDWRPRIEQLLGAAKRPSPS
jgi:precorrin-2 dehydrogenase / sirohydrochlorin ferrochelatase